MADNCSVIDPWLYCKEPWMTEAFARDNAALTRALQISISSSSPSSSSGVATAITSPESATAITSPFLHHHHGSAARRRDPLAPAAGAKVAKRKSRTSKRTPTTYINADPENFREMVQRVTGGRLDVEPAFEPVIRPEPCRPAGSNRAFLPPPVCLPTLDTSAFLLDRSAVGPGSAGLSEPVGPVEEPVFDIDSFVSGFPTLESWDCL